MTRGAVVLAGLATVIAVIGLLTRPFLHSMRADTVTADLGILPAPSERARTVDEHVLAGIESYAFGPELRLRLDRPARRVNLDPFLIDRCEVPQIEFERFAKWYEAKGGPAGTTGASSASGARTDGAGERHRQPGTASSDPRPPLPFSISTGHRIAGVLNSPATGVDVFAAALYCAAVGGRLPWAEELEAAAAGKDGRLYPWGNTFDPGHWPYLDAWRNAARPCGAHPPSDSPQGVHDLGGNAMEWSGGSLAAHPERRRPAAHGAPAVRSRARPLYALAAAWLPIEPTTRSHHLGFRCAYDASPPEKRPWGSTAGSIARIEGGEYPIGLPPDVRIARLAVVLPDAQLRNARTLLATAEASAPRIEVDRCEVSRRAYRAFLRDPLARSGLFANPQEPAGEDYVPDDWERQTEDLDLPVSGMSWWAADAYARWAGGRLPRAREWQLLAAGPEARIYPWGNRYEPEAAATADLPQPAPRTCEATELRDASTGGVLHLAGNVSEWTQSIVVERGSYAMWVQGGNWLLPGRETAQSSFGRLVPLNHRSPDIGLRVIYD